MLCVRRKKRYIGNFAVLAGDLKTRTRCREYLQWLLAQRRGSVPPGRTSPRGGREGVGRWG